MQGVANSHSSSDDDSDDDDDAEAAGRVQPVDILPGLDKEDAEVEEVDCEEAMRETKRVRGIPDAHHLRTHWLP